MIKLQHPLDRWKNPVMQWFGKPKVQTAQFYKELGLDGHNGIDFRCGTGTKVKAMHDGTIEIGTSASGPGYKGNKWVRVWDRERKFMTFYCHLSEHKVTNGKVVKAGDVIGLSGNTGKYTTGPHLHIGLYELTRNGNSIKNYDNGYHGAIDPKYCLAFELKDGDLVKAPEDPMVFLMKNGYRWWIKDEETFKLWFGYPVSKAEIKQIDLITQNSYEYAKTIGN